MDGIRCWACSSGTTTRRSSGLPDVNWATSYSAESSSATPSLSCSSSGRRTSFAASSRRPSASASASFTPPYSQRPTASPASSAAARNRPEDPDSFHPNLSWPSAAASSPFKVRTFDTKKVKKTNKSYIWLKLKLYWNFEIHCATGVTTELNLLGLLCVITSMLQGL